MHTVRGFFLVFIDETTVGTGMMTCGGGWVLECESWFKIVWGFGGSDYYVLRTWGLIRRVCDCDCIVGIWIGWVWDIDYSGSGDGEVWVKGFQHVDRIWMLRHSLLSNLILVFNDRKLNNGRSQILFPSLAVYVRSFVRSFVWNNDSMKQDKNNDTTSTEQRIVEHGHVQRMIQANIRSFDL